MPEATGPGTLTDDIWWAAQPPQVQALRYMPAGAKKNAAIQALVAQGALLNGPVVGMGWGPAWQQQYLTDAKYPWFPALGYPQLAGAPAIIDPGPRPPWGIPVSTDAAHYPPFEG